MLRAKAMTVVQEPILAADVGGTHARVGLVRAASGGRLAVLAYRKYVCAEFPDLGAILRDFMEKEAGTAVAECALACAGYALNGTVINTNLPWAVSIQELRADLEFDRLSLINDFEAVAYAARFVERAKTVLLAGPEIAEGPILVVGPGTGLGSAVYIPGKARATVLATEAGQINLAPVTALERELLARLAIDDAYVSYEHVLSGPGLQTLYGVLGRMRGCLSELTSPEAITAAALDGSDRLAVEALEVFCALLGSFTGNLAMLYSARGGVYLTGGILPRIRGYLERSRFVERFLDKGRMRAFLERVPVRLMEHGQLGVLGAAGWYLDNRDGFSADNGGGRQ